MTQDRVRPTLLVATVLLCGILAFAAVLRLEEPLRSPALAAEDPYTHVVFAKEIMDRGAFGDSRNLGTTMYPPGLHALMVVLGPWTGFGVYEFARFAPVAFGLLAVLGTYLLAARLGGALAGLVAAFAVAVMPEHVFRTNLMFPTALDLAIIPAWLLAFHLACHPGGKDGLADPAPRRGAIFLFAAMTPALAFTHPWVVPLFAAPAGVYVAMRVVRAGGGFLVAARRLALPAVLLVLACAFAMASRWDESDTGFADFMAHVGPLAPLANLQLPAPLLFILLMGILSLAAAPAVALAAALATLRAPRVLRIVLGAVAAIALVSGALFLGMARELPLHVDYRYMLGPVPVTLALAGLALALVRPTPLGDLGLALGLVLYPLTAINFFDSEFWPERTVVYLSVGVALLAGSAVGAGGTRLLRFARTPARRRALAPVGLAAALLLVAGATLAEPAPTYPWYRLYDDASFAGLQEAAERVGSEEGARVFVQTWQPALVVRALGDTDVVWFSPEFFKDGGAREKQIGQVEGPIYVVVDKHTLKNVDKGKASLGFLEDDRFEVVHETEDGKFRLYRMEASG